MILLLIFINMRKLVILDYCNSTLNIYDVDSKVFIDESYITKLGYTISNCEWMCGIGLEINYHKEVLK